MKIAAADSSCISHDHRIDASGVIKVADFGLAEKMYTSGYFRQDKSGDVKLPFKWMPLESLQEGLFSQKSDVVSCVCVQQRFPACCCSTYIDFEFSIYSSVHCKQMLC